MREAGNEIVYAAIVFVSALESEQHTKLVKIRSVQNTILNTIFEHF